MNADLTSRAGKAATGSEADTPIMFPTYYVRHPDGSYSIAQPQPTQEQIAGQSFIYAQCDRKHGGSCCEDPDCFRVGCPELADSKAFQQFHRERIEAACQHDAEQAKPTLGTTGDQQ